MNSINIKISTILYLIIIHCKIATISTEYLALKAAFQSQIQDAKNSLKYFGAMETWRLTTSIRLMKLFEYELYTPKKC